MRNLIMRKLWAEKRKFVESRELKNFCKKLGKDYHKTISYLLSRRYLIRVLRGIFYVKSAEEITLNKINLNHLELVASGLKLKGIKNWYYGLYTALRLNYLTHEYYSITYIINDKIFRAKEIEIEGHKFKFIKIKPSLIFGIKTSKRIRFSDVEKTILDFIYLKRYRGVSEEKIRLDALDLIKEANKKKLLRYAKKYPKTVSETVNELI